MMIPGPVNNILNALRQAGDGILSVEKSGLLDIKYKDDQSPLTRADNISSSIIKNFLQEEYPAIPVLCEEDEMKASFKGKSESFWLLDPLDGTREFIKGNGEYCISLALIRGGRPVEGYIYWPSQDISWYALKGKGACRVEKGEAQTLPLEHKAKDSPLLLLRSRSHHKENEELWYEKASSGNEILIKEQGSAIKFCLIAEGKADLYIKKGKIYGWDIAAGDLILAESGGRLMAYGKSPGISYGFNNSEMPHFLACSTRIDNPSTWLF